MKSKLIRSAGSRATSCDGSTGTAAHPQSSATLSSLTAKKETLGCSLDKTSGVRHAIYAIANGASYLSVDQVGRVLGIADQTVRNQISTGVFAIPSIKVGRRRLVQTEDVIAFVLRCDA